MDLQGGGQEFFFFIIPYLSLIMVNFNYNFCWLLTTVVPHISTLLDFPDEDLNLGRNVGIECVDYPEPILNRKSEIILSPKSILLP